MKKPYRLKSITVVDSSGNHVVIPTITWIGQVETVIEETPQFLKIGKIKLNFYLYVNEVITGYWFRAVTSDGVSHYFKFKTKLEAQAACAKLVQAVHRFYK